MIGQTLGQYRIVEEIGRGGMGVVYLAEHVELGAQYAVKVLPEELSCTAAFVQRFKTEARIMARLNHSNIVRVFNLGTGGDRYYLVMDLILSPGGTPKHLGHLIEERGGTMTPAETREIVLQICSALEYAHTYTDDLVKDGVVHRDLKPANILFGPDGRVCISDFGLAKIIGGDFILSRVNESFSRSIGDHETVVQDDQPPSPSDADGVDSVGSEPTLRRGSPHSSDEAILGTYDYMSPEQKDPRRAATVDCRSDIFALGVIAYRMLTGRKPEGFFELPSKLDPSVPALWDDILGRALRPEPDDRFESVAKIVEALGVISPETAPPPTPTPRTTEPAKEPAAAAKPVQVPSETEGEFCDLCGWKLDEDDIFCGGCQKLSRPKVLDEQSKLEPGGAVRDDHIESAQESCDMCGAKLNEGDEFCPACGARVLKGGS